MKFNELVNKEVIDQMGNVLGKVKNIEWDAESKEVINIEISSGGFKDALGMSDHQILPYDSIESIGDKVLLKKQILEPVKTPEKEEETDNLDFYSL
ncbi:MAG: photosystem reaction center subunit H [Methanobacterium sp.]|nr:photosystem reaction center subunit H [Methanobacterium sp.]